jgi:hypothetical protein
MPAIIKSSLQLLALILYDCITCPQTSMGMEDQLRILYTPWNDALADLSPGT